MRKGLSFFLAGFIVLMLMAGCGSKPVNPDTSGTIEEKGTEEAELTESSSPEPDARSDEDKYSFTTTMPDGTQRIEADFLEFVNDENIRISNHNGEQEIKISATVKEHIEKLDVKQGDIVILYLTDGIATSVEKVSS